MEKQNIIMWQKWADPFGLDDNEDTTFDPYLADYFDDDDDEQNIDEDNEDKKISKIEKSKPVKVIATPMGIIPMNDNTASGKIFNFWVGHTNFDISHKIASIIEKTDGVETLDIFTRYRFRIGVGKAFEDSQIMRDINKRVYKELNNG